MHVDGAEGEDGFSRGAVAWTRILEALESWCHEQHDLGDVDRASVAALLQRWAGDGMGLCVCQERLTEEEEMLLQWVLRRAAKALQKDVLATQLTAEECARRAEQELLGELEREAEQLNEAKDMAKKKKAKKKSREKEAKEKKSGKETPAPQDAGEGEKEVKEKKPPREARDAPNATPASIDVASP